MSGESHNLAGLLEHNALHDGRAPALRTRRHGLQRTFDWQVLGKRVEALARGLAALGFAEGSVLVTLTDARPCWLLAALAVHRLGGTVLPLARDASHDELSRAASATRPRFVLVQGTRQVERILTVREKLAPDVRIFHVDPAAQPAPQTVDLRHIELVEHMGERSADVATLEAVPAPLSPAFITFERHAEGGSTRLALSHEGLIQEAQNTQVALQEPHELWLDPAHGFDARGLVGLAAWLLHGRQLGLGDARP